MGNEEVERRVLRSGFARESVRLQQQGQIAQQLHPHKPPPKEKRRRKRKGKKTRSWGDLRGTRTRMARERCREARCSMRGRYTCRHRVSSSVVPLTADAPLLRRNLRLYAVCSGKEQVEVEVVASSLHTREKGRERGREVRRTHWAEMRERMMASAQARAVGSGLVASLCSQAKRDIVGGGEKVKEHDGEQTWKCNRHPTGERERRARAGSPAGRPRSGSAPPLRGRRACVWWPCRICLPPSGTPAPRSHHYHDITAPRRYHTVSRARALRKPCMHKADG